MEDKVLDLLIEYYLNLNPVGKKEYWNEDIFEQKVYTAWGVMEIYNEIKNKLIDNEVYKRVNQK